MEWLFAILIVGAMAYMATIVLEYVNYAQRITPRLAELAQEATRQEGAISSEQYACIEVHERTVKLKQALGELNSQIVCLREEIQEQQQHRQRLEVEATKQRLKKRRATMM